MMAAGKLVVSGGSIAITFLVFVQLLCTETAKAQGPALEQQLLSEPVQDLAADAREKGDATRGAFLFHSPGLGCVKCHGTNPRETSFGPDLSSWKKDVDDNHLVESVLRPSEKIDPQYQSLMIVTNDGRTLTGVPRERDQHKLTMQTGIGKTDIISISLDDIEIEKRTEVSVMPVGQVNALRRRQQFLDLVSYLIAIRDGGPEAAKLLQPSAESLRLQIPEYESNIDHRGMIADWNDESLERGEAIYQGLCVNCHGTVDKPGSLPTSLPFATGKFKFGRDPFSIYQTLTHGGGLMVPQTWMVPQQKYDVIHYLREHFLRDHNRSQYSPTDEQYLASLPKGDSRGPEPQVIQPWVTMDYGPMLTTTIEFGDDGSNIAQKAIAIRLDDGPGGVSRGKAWMVFEHDTLRMAAAWTENFVDWNGIQFNGRHGVHLRAAGKICVSNPTGPGWANPSTGKFDDDARVVGRDDRRYGPLPKSWGKFRGLHRYENKIILRYTVGQTEILERPSLLLQRSMPVFARTLNLGSRQSDLKMAVMTVNRDASITRSGDFSVVHTEQGQVSVAIPGFGDSAELRIDDGRLVLQFTKGSDSLRGTLLFTEGTVSDESKQAIHDQLALLGNDLRPQTNGGPAQYSTAIEVPAEKWFESDAWAVDELVRPEGNPWLARTRVTGIDFYPGGDSMAVCTWDGDVWRVDGLKTIGQPDSVLRWSRIATGLFQPLGILVDGDRLMVSCRDQLVSLGDANGDGEMDDYRCFNSDHQVTEHFHEFAMGLQRDKEGNFYYAKSARHALTAVVPHHGTLLRVPPSGDSTDILATGFRAANGVCLNDDGSFIVTDQEGHWNPKNRINWVRPGGFYGNMFGYHDVTDASDEAMDQPLCWITNQFDRSPAELLWADTDRWGPLGGQLLNLSYGYGRIYVVPHEHVSLPTGDRQPQGGMCQLPIPDLPTGMIRGRFSPHDGQLYVGGMFSWAGSRQEQEGGLFRVRYKGARVDMPVGLRAVDGGIDLTFTDPLDAAAATDVHRYQVKVWDLKRTKNYGSEHFNERKLPISMAELTNDNKTIRIRIPDLQPTWGMEIACRLKTSEGKEFRRVIHNTVHQLGPR
jgi:putative heme-binding domain-containing protein